MKITTSFIGLGILLLITALINISTGSVSIPIPTIWNSFFSPDDVSQNIIYIIQNYRLPKLITALFTGAGLGISGLLMQTFFKNPLAGPFVLGISSGASLGVAILILGSGLLGFSATSGLISVPFAAVLGAFTVLLIVLITSRNIRNSYSILIIGLMFGSFSAAIISVLSYLSTAQELQQFVFWSLGSLSNLNWTEIQLLAGISLLCFVGLIPLSKSLNTLLLGEAYAHSLGLNIKYVRYGVFIITSLLTGIITAFAGPIGFVGLAVPHLTKLVFKSSNHHIVIPAVALVGACLLLVCDTLSHLTFHHKTLPINAITSLLGAPLVIWLLVKQTKRN